MLDMVVHFWDNLFWKYYFFYQFFPRKVRISGKSKPFSFLSNMESLLNETNSLIFFFSGRGAVQIVSKFPIIAISKIYHF